MSVNDYHPNTMIDKTKGQSAIQIVVDALLGARNHIGADIPNGSSGHDSLDYEWDREYWEYLTYVINVVEAQAPEWSTSAEIEAHNEIAKALGFPLFKNCSPFAWSYLAGLILDLREAFEKLDAKQKGQS